MIRFAIILGLTCLSACERQPRAVAFFEANPDAAKAAKEACRQGRLSGPECENAAIGYSRAKRAARMEMFRGGFEK